MEFFREKDFKVTKIGEIPKDWHVDILDEYAIIKGRIGWRGLKSSEYTKEGPFLIANTHIPKNRVEWEKCDHLSMYRYEESPEIQLKVRDVIMSKDGTIGQVAYIDYLPGEATLNSTMLLLRSKNKDLCSYYLYYFLQGFQFRKFLNQKTAGGQIPHIFQRDMKELLIPLPKRQEQKDIAELLSRVDKSIQKTDEIIQRTQELKKGLMQKLLTKGIGHKKFKYREELGCEIPKEWSLKAVSELCKKPEYGYTQSATEKPIGPKFLRITDIQDGKVFWNKVPFCKCPESLIPKYLLQAGDILFARSGATTGKSYLIKDCPKAVFASYLIRVRTKEEIVPEFLYYFFNSYYYWKQVKQKIGGSAQGGMNASLLSEIMVHFPIKQEQQQIASILSKIDDQIEKERQTKEQLEKLKKGLMQLLLTGKVRVKVN